MTDMEAASKEPPRRHPGIEHLLSLYEYQHLPPHLQDVSLQFYDLAHHLVFRLGEGIELTAGLRKLLEAKDCCVRQAVINHHRNS